MALGVRLQLRSELRSVDFTPRPLLGAPLLLLDKTAENDLVFCGGSCVCVTELAQRQRRDLLRWVTVPCGTIPLCLLLAQNLWKVGRSVS